MALLVGITGGIGSGKSSICSVFKLLGVPVFEADFQAKKLVNTNSKIKSGLIDLFGDHIYTPNGTINSNKLAGIIFKDEAQLSKVNELIHPVVRAEFQIWAQKQDVPYVVHEAAILFESGFYKIMDYTILVSAPEEMRIERVTKRDGSAATQVKERIDRQWSDKQKRELANIEIKNDNKNLILPQIIEIDKRLKEYGKVW